MKAKKILIIVDVQNDFISGSLKNEDAIDAIPNIVKKINNFDGDYIIVTMDTHYEDYLNSKEGKKLPVTHCVKGSYGWSIEKNVQLALNDANNEKTEILYFEKPTFGSIDLMNFVEMDEDFDCNLEIEFIGFCTDICVVSNALLLKAALYDRCEITVDASCCAGVTPEKHKAALETMKSCQINVINE